MLKKIIFDVDNTLIPWKDEYVLALKDAVEEFNINVNYKKIDNIIESLENKYEILTKEDFLKDINEEFNLNLGMDFIDELFKKQYKLAPIDNNLIETIKYLSSKYELVVLTNYFTEVQSGRLQTAGILKYFKNVYGGDAVKLKPNKEAFLKAIYPNNIDECIMIGDSLKHDLNLDIGLKTIIVDNKNILESNNEYTVIKKITDLKDIL